MRDFDDTTLCEASDFEVVRQTNPTSGLARLDGPVTLSSTLLAELGHGRAGSGPGSDVLEVAAACLRQREPALLFCMSAERAGHLLNALYLTSCLMATQTHPAAGAPPGLARGRLGGLQRRP